MKSWPAILCALLLSSCNLTRDVSVSQGSERVAQHIDDLDGLAKDEIRRLLGPPQSRWNIDGEVWVYHYKEKDRSTDEWVTAEIHFDEQGNLLDVKVNKKQQSDEGG